MKLLYDANAERASWFELACEIGKIFETLGWADWEHLPRPIGRTTRRAVRYRDTWQFFPEQYKKQIHELLEHWCFNREWKFPLTEELNYLLQLRSYIVATFIENLYVGPGKHGETLIPFPRQPIYPKLMLWFLVPWFEDKGSNLLFCELDKTFWSGKSRKLMGLSPKTRALFRSPSRTVDRSPGPDPLS